MTEIRVGIIGMGNMGKAHATTIANGEIEGLKLTAVCDIVAEKCDSFKSEYQDIKTFINYAEMLESSLCDAIIVAVPHKLHALISSQALLKEHHVLVEKPVDISASLARELNETAKMSGKVFCIMFNQRTNPLFRKAKEIVSNGELGKIKRSVWICTNWYRTQSYYDSGDWRATWSGEGGGVLLNQAPHQLDLWQWICGMPTSVTAFCDVAKYHNIEVEDDVTIFTKYADGATGAFITTTGEYPGTNRLEISGTLGKIVIENGLLKWWKLRESERDVCFTDNHSSPSIETTYEEIKQEAQETAHRGILQNFANAVLHNEPLIAPGYDGINELSISNAAYLSAWEGNKEIKLPFDEEKFDKLLKEKAKKSLQKDEIHLHNANGEYKKRWSVKW